MDKRKIIYTIVESLVLTALISVMAITVQKMRRLEVMVSELQERMDESSGIPTEEKEISAAKEESITEQPQNNAQDGKKKEDSADSNVTAEQSTASGNSQPSDAATPNTPVQSKYITSIINYKAGTELKDEDIDTVNISQYFTKHMIVEGDEVYDRINGKSYVPNDNIRLENLRYLKLLHRNYNGLPQVGELIVNAVVAEEILEIFTALYQMNYQVYSMHLIDDYWTEDGEKSDNASIEENNTSAFCYRFTIGSDTDLSKHAYGYAIDLNPMENPYVKVQEDGTKTTYHENAQQYIDNRSSEIPHVIDENDQAYKLFTEHGFIWGGHWDNPIDYQHFEKIV